MEDLKIHIINYLNKKGIKSLFLHLRNGIYLDKLIEETKWLDEQSIYKITTSQRIYHLLNNIKEIPKCPICNKQVNFCGTGKHYNITCSNKCSAINTLDKRRDTCIEKYGYTNNSKSPINKEIVSKTWENKTTGELLNIDNKKKKTYISRYNVENPSQLNEFQEKKKSTSLKRYGTENSNQAKEVKERKKKTNLERYGVEYPMQNAEFFEKQQKSAYKFKSYILPSGKEVKIQGYENKFLDEYFLNGGKEDDILISTKDINDYLGIIWYHNLDNKKHRYYPDFYLIKENKIIEVKSTYTINCDIEELLLKQQACLYMGLDFEFKIYEGK